MNYQKRVLLENIPPSVNLIQYVIIPPGGRIPPHAHHYTSEIFYITRGNVRAEIEGKVFELSERDLLFVDVGEKHSFTNLSNESLEMLVLKINFRRDDQILYPENEDKAGYCRAARRGCVYEGSS